MDIRRDVPHWWKLIGIVCMFLVIAILVANYNVVYEPNPTIRTVEIIVIAYGLIEGTRWFIRSVNNDPD